MTRLVFALAAAACLALTGCHSHPADDAHSHDASDGHTHAVQGTEDHGHDHSHAGQPSEEYMEHLESPERAAWQKPDEVVSALALAGDETVVDIGAGTGYFAMRLAKAVPEGEVYGTDVEEYMIDFLTRRADKEGVKNLRPVLTRTDDPGVPEETDLVFICNVLHHVSDRPIWLAKIRENLSAEGRIALVEFVEGELPVGPPPSMKIPRDELLSLFEEAGFQLAEEQSELLPYQHFLLFRRN